MTKKPATTIPGIVTIEGATNVWEHELFIARALVNAGHSVRFIPSNSSARSADAYVDNTIYEFKSPEGSTIKSIERNIFKAINHQSANVVICTIRMKKIQDRSVLNYLSSNRSKLRGVKRLIFVNREGKAIDIN